MSTIMIHDLKRSDELDRAAMSAIKGAGAEWVFGWIVPFRERSDAGSFGTVVNFYQINNYAEQMINQFQTVKVDNTGANSNVNVNVAEAAKNLL